MIRVKTRTSALNMKPRFTFYSYFLQRTNATSITLPGENSSFLYSFRAFKFPARMLIGNCDKSPVCSEAVAPLFKNVHIGSFFACITKPIVINVEPLFLIEEFPKLCFFLCYNISCFSFNALLNSSFSMWWQT